MKLTEQENYAINQIVAVADGIRRIADIESKGGICLSGRVGLMAEEIIHLIEDLETSLKNR